MWWSEGKRRNNYEIYFWVGGWKKMSIKIGIIDLRDKNSWGRI